MISCTVLSDSLVPVRLCVCERNDHTRRVQCHIGIVVPHLPSLQCLIAPLPPVFFSSAKTVVVKGDPFLLLSGRGCVGRTLSTPSTA